MSDVKAPTSGSSSTTPSVVAVPVDASELLWNDSPGPEEAEFKARNPELVWKDSSAVTSCALCKTSFGLLVRRHHCRLCGDVFCHSCSSKQTLINAKLERCCTPCFDGASQLDREVESHKLARLASIKAARVEAEAARLRDIDVEFEREKRAMESARLEKETSASSALSTEDDEHEVKRKSAESAAESADRAEFLRRKPLGVWRESTAAKHCVRCKASFGLLLRRHHCRECGEVVCASCSVGRVLVHGIPKRCCPQCHDTLAFQAAQVAAAITNDELARQQKQKEEEEEEEEAERLEAEEAARIKAAADAESARLAAADKAAADKAEADKAAAEIAAADKAAADTADAERAAAEEAEAEKAAAEMAVAEQAAGGGTASSPSKEEAEVGMAAEVGAAPEAASDGETGPAPCPSSEASAEAGVAAEEAKQPKAEPEKVSGGGDRRKKGGKNRR